VQHHGCQSQAALLDLLNGLRSDNRPCGLLICTFRNMRKVEAIHGSREAERLIASGEARLLAACPPGTSILRLQHDELAVVVPDTRTSAELLDLGERCTNHCRAVEQGAASNPLLLTVSIGAALAGVSAESSSIDLLNQALLAQLEADKQPGSHLVLAPTQIQQLEAAQYQLESELHLALERHELTTFLQPIVDLISGDPIGFECLARWPMATGELAPPASFMAAANESGITAEIDLQVLRRALEAAPQLADAAGERHPLILSANLSGQLVENPRRVLELLELIRAHPLPMGVQLQLELLEESFKNAAYELDALLDWLAEQNVLIAIDDFGTGYSSLNRLHDLSINTIKIDRSFMQRLNAPQKSSNHLLQTLVAIAHDLQINLTAEGVETDEQRRWLMSRGVSHGQGYLFSKPLSLAGAIDYLNRPQRAIRS